MLLKMIKGKFHKNTKQKTYTFELSDQIDVTVRSDYKFDDDDLIWLQNKFINKLKQSKITR